VLQTLSTRISLVLLGVFCVIGIVFFLVVRQLLDRHMLEVTQRLNRPLAHYVVGRVLRNSSGPPDRFDLESVFSQLMLINPAVELYLLDGDGRIRAYSAPPGEVRLDRVDPAPIVRYLAQDSAMPIFGTDPRAPGRMKIFSAATLSRDPGAGYLYVVLGGQQFDRFAADLRREYAPRLVLWAAALGGLFAVLSASLIYLILTRRLRSLARDMDAFRDSGFAAIGAVATLRGTRGGDEVDRLTATFRQMAERIVDQLGMLKQTDDSRRRLVAGVSHDLRTPLASIQGYLETLRVREGALSAEEKRNCIDTALKSSRRLTRMVNELFDLAKLEMPGQDLAMDRFNVAELVQDLIQEFRLSAGTRNIVLRDRFDQALPEVLGNIGLVQRAFVNLIDNALRHTPAGGEVTVELIQHGDDVRVTVADTGSGIPPEDLAYVFEPFYRASDPSEVGAAEGSGLGLAIVSRIIELHGGSIGIEQSDRDGTRFVFALPIATARRRGTSS
jgi:two-component system, OmpR family, sensor kinase